MRMHVNAYLKEYGTALLLVAACIGILAAVMAGRYGPVAYGRSLTLALPAGLAGFVGWLFFLKHWRDHGH